MFAVYTDYITQVGPGDWEVWEWLPFAGITPPPPPPPPGTVIVSVGVKTVGVNNGTGGLNDFYINQCYVEDLGTAVAEVVNRDANNSTPFTMSMVVWYPDGATPLDRSQISPPRLRGRKKA